MAAGIWDVAFQNDELPSRVPVNEPQAAPPLHSKGPPGRQFHLQMFEAEPSDAVRRGSILEPRTDPISLTNLIGVQVLSDQFALTPNRGVLQHAALIVTTALLLSDTTEGVKRIPLEGVSL